MNLIFAWMPSGPELIVILVIILVFFGAKRIPELAKGLGKGIREFKNASRDIKSELEEGLKEEDKPA